MNQHHHLVARDRLSGSELGQLVRSASWEVPEERFSRHLVKAAIVVIGGFKPMPTLNTLLLTPRFEPRPAGRRRTVHADAEEERSGGPRARASTRLNAAGRLVRVSLTHRGYQCQTRS